MPDLSAYNWEEISSVDNPDARTGASMVWAGDQVILFGGGNSFSPFASLSDTWSLNTSTDEWTELSPSTTPPARQFAVMVWDPVGERVLMHGGRYFSSYWRVRLDTWQYEIGGDWTQLETAGPGEPDGSVNTTNHINSGVWDTANDRMLFNVGTTIPRVNELWEYASDTWTELTPSPVLQMDVTSGSPDPDPQVLWAQSAAWDPDSELMYLTCGSWDTDRTTAATWSYDGTGFTQVAGEGVGGSTPGTHRARAAMVWAGDRGFLFGGDTQTIGGVGRSPSNPNYSFSTPTWTLLSPGTIPDARYGHSMIWNGTCAYMFGGTSETGSAGAEFGDTWKFCGAAPVDVTYYEVNHAFGLT